jgi:uncharacterized protein (DUF1330 family)
MRTHRRAVDYAESQRFTKTKARSQMNSKKVQLTVAAAALLMTLAFAVVRAATSAVLKGYVIAEITVTDPQAYKEYAATVPAIVAKFGGKYLVRGGQTIAVEGDPPSDRIVVIEFDSLAAARSFEASPEYRAVAPLRRKAARSRVFLAEGVAQ